MKSFLLLLSIALYVAANSQQTANDYFEAVSVIEVNNPSPTPTKPSLTVNRLKQAVFDRKQTTLIATSTSPLSQAISSDVQPITTPNDPISTKYTRKVHGTRTLAGYIDHMKKERNYVAGPIYYGNPPVEIPVGTALYYIYWAHMRKRILCLGNVLGGNKASVCSDNSGLSLDSLLQKSSTPPPRSDDYIKIIEKTNVLNSSNNDSVDENTVQEGSEQMNIVDVSGSFNDVNADGNLPSTSDNDSMDGSSAKEELTVKFFEEPPLD